MDSLINTCNKCGTKTKMFYCPNCGTIFDYPSFVANNEKRKRSLQNFILEVVKVAKKQRIDVSSAIDSSSVRKAIYRKYYEHIAYLQKLCSNKTTQSYFMSSGTNMFDQMNDFAEKCELGECQIAVVGTVKAGKSMLINALLGKEIASSFPTPETASVTKFRKSERGDYVKISFYSSNEWQELWDSVHGSTNNAIEGDENEDFQYLYDELKADQVKNNFLNKNTITYSVDSLQQLRGLIDKFTSARFAEHFFAKEVEVGLSDFFAPSNVVIVDTPGLDDPVPYRTDITRRYLHNANVVLLCIRSNRPELSSTELQQLSYIFAELRFHKDRIITIGTQIDEPDNMLEFWQKYTLPEYLKYLSRSTLYGSKEVAMSHICPLSAYYYLLLNRAKDTPEIFKDKSDEAKKLKRKILEIVRKTYDIPEYEDLVDELGEDEAQKIYRSPKQVFISNIDELISMTQVPQVRQMLLDGPIHNANDIIISDIKQLFMILISEIKKVSLEVASHRKATIEMSEASDISNQIATLEKRIIDEKRIQSQQAAKLSEIIVEMEAKSRNSLNKIRR